MKKKTKNVKNFKSNTLKVAAAKWSVSKGEFYRPTRVEINQKAFISNIKTMRSLCKKNTKLLAVVKANAYGHTAIALSKIALENGADMLGVSSIEEGIELRDNSIKAPILILGSLYPFDNLKIAGKNNLIPTISSRKLLEEYIKTAKGLNKRLEFHIKVDTGMGRIGVTPKTAIDLLNQIKTIKEVKLSGIYTHFSSADNDKQYTLSQINEFSKVIDIAKKTGYRITAHSANSAASIKYKDSHFDMIRPGISLYGLLPFAKADEVVNLKPVLSWKTRIVFLKNVPESTSISYGRTFITKRKSKIATLPVGYADGYSRLLSNRSDVLINGKRCPVIGRVTMDMIMVDVTGLEFVKIGDEAVLIGMQDKEVILAEEIADLTGTINYEVTCSINSRVPRVIV